jgi:hypothetical protein
MTVPRRWPMPGLLRETTSAAQSCHQTSSQATSCRRVALGWAAARALVKPGALRVLRHRLQHQEKGTTDHAGDSVGVALGLVRMGMVVGDVIGTNRL